MGSFRHPKVYDPVTLKSVRDVFHAILEELDDQVVVLSISEERLKADIIEQLLALVAHNTPQDEWKEKVLSTLPLR